MDETDNQKHLVKNTNTKSRKKDMDETNKEEDLVIDTSPNTRSRNRNKNRGRKRKRISSTSSTDFVLTSNSIELEKNLQASALKNNLDDTSVKKIIKKVVTNDHVLALVKLREEEEASSTDEDVPTLTRSKAKTIKKVPMVTAPWNLQLEPIEHIPVKTRPEVEALIAQELPEDEDDEEYNPTNEDIPSDDDHIESCSDLESQPRTPATPRRTDSPRVVKDGPFVVPQDVSKVSRQLNLEEEATIALRTRSKLSLSSTPIEHIEGSFVPPDELPQTDVDEIWNDFLKECLNPAPNVHDDDDDDPEYNVAADPDATEDEESLEKSIIKISKKELEDILTELCQVMPQPEKDIQNTQEVAASVTMETVHWDGKREILSDEEQQSNPIFNRRRLSIGKTEPIDDEYEDTANEEQTEDCAHRGKVIAPIAQEQAPRTRTAKPTPHNSAPPKPASSKPTPPKPPKDVTMAVEEGVAELLRGGEGDTPAVVKIVTSTTPEVVVNIDDSVKFLPEQRLLLEQQLRQHVQLCASHFMQVCINPKHWGRATKFREYLESLNKIADDNPSSIVNVCNLRPALELINEYETTVTAVTPENQEMVKFIADEMDRMTSRTSNKHTYRGQFPERFKQVVANSSVFLYPYLLPPSPFRPQTPRRTTYLRSEDELIALGLDEFFWYVEHNPELYRLPSLPGRRGLQAATALVCRHLLPWLQPHCLAAHIFTVRKSKDGNNPIYKFIKNRTVEPVKHKLLPFDTGRTLYDQPEHEMPRSWVAYLAKTNKRFRSFLYKRTHVNGAAPIGLEIDGSKILSNFPPTSTSLPIEPIRTLNRGNERKEVPATTTPTLTVASMVYNMVTTSNGIVLVPQTTPQAALTTATSAITQPICSVEHSTTPTITIDSGKLLTTPQELPGISFVRIAQKPENTGSQPTSQSNGLHCKCCELLRKICRTRQTLITDFIRNAKRKSCPCQSIKRPKMTNKLKLLIKYYATYSRTVYNRVKRSFEELQGINVAKVEEATDKPVDNEKDTAFVMSFIMKLAVRMNTLKTIYPKQRIDEILQAYDINSGNPLYLAADLHKFLALDEMSLYREFMAFLTPDQADRLEKYRDHFIGNYMEDYMKKIEEGIPNKDDRYAVTQKLLSMFGKTTSTACECCSGLLETLRNYPALAEYTFYLFPHRRKDPDNFYRKSSCANKNIDNDLDEEEATVTSEVTNPSLNSKTQKIITKRPLVTVKNKTPTVNNNKENNETSKTVTDNSNNTSPKINNNKQNNEALKGNNNKESNETMKIVTEKPNNQIQKTINKKPNRKKACDSETSSSEEEDMSMSEGSTTEADDDEQSSDDEKGDEEVKEEAEVENMEVDRESPVQLLTEVKDEPSDTYEITYTTTEVQHRDTEISQSAETAVESEVNVKMEPLEWKREEDKSLLELMKKSLADGKVKTIYSIVESQQDKFLECCDNKSLLDITKRLFHLLQVVNES